MYLRLSKECFLICCLWMLWNRLLILGIFALFINIFFTVLYTTIGYFFTRSQFPFLAIPSPQPNSLLLIIITRRRWMRVSLLNLTEQTRSNILIRAGTCSSTCYKSSRCCWSFCCLLLLCWWFMDCLFEFPLGLYRLLFCIEIVWET